jgi:hypothetical protein
MFWSIVIGFVIGFWVIIFVGEFYVIEDSDEIINH